MHIFKAIVALDRFAYNDVIVRYNDVIGGRMQDIKKKTDEKEDPAVEHFCSLYARIAL